MIRNELTKTDLKTSDFNFDLPEELISQHAYEKRDERKERKERYKDKEKDRNYGRDKK